MCSGTTWFKCSCWRASLVESIIVRLSQHHGFDPPCGSHQLPVFLKYSCKRNSNIYENARRLWLGTNFSGFYIGKSCKWSFTQNYKVQAYVISMEFSAVNRRCPSRETPLRLGEKKDGCFRSYLKSYDRFQNRTSPQLEFNLKSQVWLQNKLQYPKFNCHIIGSILKSQFNSQNLPSNGFIVFHLVS